MTQALGRAAAGQRGRAATEQLQETQWGLNPYTSVPSGVMDRCVCSCHLPAAGGGSAPDDGTHGHHGQATGAQLCDCAALWWLLPRRWPGMRAYWAAPSPNAGTGAGGACRAGVDAGAVGAEGCSQNPGWWASCPPSSLWNVSFFSSSLSRCLSPFFQAQILMIRYPSSQLGEMSLEEHSQCECRCQPGPLSKLAKTRLGGAGHRGKRQWGPGFQGWSQSRPGIWGSRVGC